MKTFKQKNFSLISRGLRFIKELRTIDPLPITVEEYSILLFHSPDICKFFVGRFKDYNFEFSRRKEIADRINKFYKTEKASDLISKIGKSFFGGYYNWSVKLGIDFLPIYGKDKIFTEGIDYSWEKVNHIPKRYIFDSLGFGYCGVVFDYPFNKIEKINFNDFSRDEYKFFDYLIKKPISVFPRIYTLERDQVIMEKLITDSPKVEKYGELIRNLRENYWVNKQQPLDWDRFEKDFGSNNEFFKFIKACENGLFKIFNKRTLGDLHSHNIAERPKTGEIVYFDPIGGKL